MALPVAEAKARTMTRSKEYHKNCPFCGANELDGDIQVLKRGGVATRIKCICCGSLGPEAAHDEEEAWADWDVRSTATAHCAMCGKFVSRGTNFCSDDCRRNAHQQQITEDAENAGF